MVTVSNLFKDCRSTHFGEARRCPFFCSPALCMADVGDPREADRRKPPIDTRTSPTPMRWYSSRGGASCSSPIAELGNISPMKDRLIHRPAARRTLEREKSVLIRM